MPWLVIAIANHGCQIMTLAGNLHGLLEYTLETVTRLTVIQLPFVDNLYRMHRTGAHYVTAPVGSQNDQAVFDLAQQLNITFVELSHRLFHH